LNGEVGEKVNSRGRVSSACTNRCPSVRTMIQIANGQMIPYAQMGQRTRLRPRGTQLHPPSPHAIRKVHHLALHQGARAHHASRNLLGVDTSSHPRDDGVHSRRWHATHSRGSAVTAAAARSSSSSPGAPAAGPLRAAGSQRAREARRGGRIQFRQPVRRGGVPAAGAGPPPRDVEADDGECNLKQLG
jgi:hypothetical protein